MHSVMRFHANLWFGVHVCLRDSFVRQMDLSEVITVHKNSLSPPVLPRPYKSSFAFSDVIVNYSLKAYEVMYYLLNMCCDIISTAALCWC